MGTLRRQSVVDNDNPEGERVEHVPDLLGRGLERTIEPPAQSIPAGSFEPLTM
jgi:hypothetical protein